MVNYYIKVIYLPSASSLLIDAIYNKIMYNFIFHLDPVDPSIWFKTTTTTTTTTKTTKTTTTKTTTTSTTPKVKGTLLR